MKKFRIVTESSQEFIVNAKNRNEAIKLGRVNCRRNNEKFVNVYLNND